MAASSVKKTQPLPLAGKQVVALFRVVQEITAPATFEVEPVVTTFAVSHKIPFQSAVQLEEEQGVRSGPDGDAGNDVAGPENEEATPFSLGRVERAIFLRVGAGVEQGI